MIRWWPGGCNMKIIGKSTVLKMDVKKMQNSHLEFNTSSCLWKGVGLLPYLNHQYDFIPETSRPCILAKLTIIISPDPFTTGTCHHRPKCPDPHGVFVKSSAWINLQRDQLPTKLQNSKNTKTDTKFWCLKCPNSLLNISAIVFDGDFHERLEPMQLQRLTPLKMGSFQTVHFDILNVWSISPTNIPRILHFNSGSQAVPTWKLLGVSVTFMWFAGKLR